MDAHAFDILSPDIAWVLGFLWADGSYTGVGGRRLQLCSTDEMPVVALKSVLKSQNKITVSQPTGRSKLPCYHFQVTPPDALRGSLDAYGFTEVHNQFRGPPTIPAKFLADFVRGYFDGDGSVGFYLNGKRLTLKSSFCAHPALFDWLKSILADFGISGYAYQLDGGLVNYNLGLHASRILYRVMYGCAPSLYLERKKAIFAAHL
jgi:hypothetical protein